MPKLSQETTAMLGVGIGLAALILTATTGLRAEIGELGSELRTEIRDVRTEARADLGLLRAETRADREALRAEARADRESFQRHIIRLTEQHGLLSSRIDGIRDQPETTKAAPPTEPAG